MRPLQTATGAERLFVPAQPPRANLPSDASHSLAGTPGLVTIVMTVSVLEFWLSSINMSSYYQSFIDNGYDDLEICKKVGQFVLYKEMKYSL